LDYRRGHTPECCRSEVINMEMLKNAFALVEGLLVAFLGISFIVVSSLALIELSARISAKAFVQQKVDAMESQFTAEALIPRPANQEGNSKRETELRNYQAIMDDLEHLSLTGATSAQETIHALRHRLAERSRSQSTSLQLESFDEKVAYLTANLTMEQRRKNDLLHKLQELEERMQGELNGTNGTGRAGQGPVYMSLREQYELMREELARNDDDIRSTTFGIAEVRAQARDLREKELTWQPTAFVRLNPLLYMPSEMLLALVIILCGGTGSILTSLRSKKFKHLPAVFNGLLAGFIAFLVIKGGKFFFIVNVAPESAVFINPFAAAFAGVLAGLFTEKAYRVLSEAADQLGTKILGKESK
jgi:hypothetical protein